MASKIYESPKGALEGLLFDGMTIMSGSFGLLGNPESLIPEIRTSGVRGLTVISNISGADGFGLWNQGKFARDASLVARNGMDEALEPAIAGRGGSSAMVHQRNPTGCQVALSAAARAPGLVAAILGALPQEEERGLGGWQEEGPVLTDLFLLASGPTAAVAIIAEGLEIDEAAIARNLAAAGQRSDIGESEAIIADLLNHPKKG